MEDPPLPPPQRIVSLLGAATEVIYRLGCGDRLVGRVRDERNRKPLTL